MQIIDGRDILMHNKNSTNDIFTIMIYMHIYVKLIALIFTQTLSNYLVI